MSLRLFQPEKQRIPPRALRKALSQSQKRCVNILKTYTWLQKKFVIGASGAAFFVALLRTQTFSLLLVVCSLSKMNKNLPKERFCSQSGVSYKWRVEDCRLRATNHRGTTHRPRRPRRRTASGGPLTTRWRWAPANRPIVGILRGCIIILFS